MILLNVFSSYYSVSHLLLGVVLPSSSRSIFVGLIATFEGLSALSQSASTPAIIATIGDAGLFFVFAGIVAACAIFMFYMMPETKGMTLAKIEYIFMCPRHEGCAIRRDPAAKITQTVGIIKQLSRAFGYSCSQRRGGEGVK
jgi:hypothetical protein